MITLKLSEEAINQIVNELLKAPMKDVYPLVVNIESQTRTELQRIQNDQMLKKEAEIRQRIASESKTKAETEKVVKITPKEKK